MLFPVYGGSKWGWNEEICRLPVEKFTFLRMNPGVPQTNQRTILYQFHNFCSKIFHPNPLYIVIPHESCHPPTLPVLSLAPPYPPRLATLPSLRRALHNRQPSLGKRLILLPVFQKKVILPSRKPFSLVFITISKKRFNNKKLWILQEGRVNCAILCFYHFPINFTEENDAVIIILMGDGVLFQFIKRMYPEKLHLLNEL